MKDGNHWRVLEHDGVEVVAHVQAAKDLSPAADAAIDAIIHAAADHMATLPPLTPGQVDGQARTLHRIRHAAGLE